MKKIILIVISIIIVLTVGFIIKFKSNNFTKLNKVKFILLKDIDEIINNSKIKEQTEEEQIEEENTDDSIDEHDDKIEISKEIKNDSNIIKKSETNNNTVNKKVESTPIINNNEKEISRKEKSEYKAEVNEEKNDVQEETKPVEVPITTEETKKEELNVSHVYTRSETLTTDSNGNLMNQEACYKESYEILFRDSSISSSGCFSTGKYKDNGEEIYYLDVRYK